MPQIDPRTILVIGNGGREHALAWAIARSEGVDRVLVAPGNGGTDLELGVTNVDIAADDIDRLLILAQTEDVGLTVVGPENTLAAGIVDRFQAAGLPIFGPSRAAARLETSKVWAREFMRRHGVPHPEFVVAEDIESAEAAVKRLNGRCVVKADGLAAGKGVIVCDTVPEGLDAVRAMMLDRAFGEAGSRVLVEERIDGPELSVMAVCDGETYVTLPPAQDHKRLREGDEGPNTGGMGAYAPAPIGTDAVIDLIRRTVIEPTIRGMAEEGQPFTGCLYCGLMLTEDGPKVIEFNTRFGDPETQAQLPLIEEGLVDILRAAAGDGRRVADVPLRIADGKSCACVVIAAPGYPALAQTGATVLGIDGAERHPGVKVFHAGTRMERDEASRPVLVTSGGRALNVVCVRTTLSDVLDGVYGAIGGEGVRFDGMSYRKDIAFRALSPSP